MEHRTGPDSGLVSEVTAARDTLNTVLACLSLLLFALLLSLRAVQLQRDSLTARSGEAASPPEITGLRRAAAPWSCPAGIPVPAGPGDLVGQLRLWKCRRVLRQNQCMGFAPGPGGRAAAVLRPDCHPAPGRIGNESRGEHRGALPIIMCLGKPAGQDLRHPVLLVGGGRSGRPLPASPGLHWTWTPQRRRLSAWRCHWCRRRRPQSPGDRSPDSGTE